MYETQHGGTGGEGSSDVEQIARVKHLHKSISDIECSVRALHVHTFSVESKTSRSSISSDFPRPCDTAAMTRPLCVMADIWNNLSPEGQMVVLDWTTHDSYDDCGIFPEHPRTKWIPSVAPDGS